jgi:hypothetical protein
MNTDETDEEAQDTCLAFDDDLDRVDDITIEEDDWSLYLLRFDFTLHHKPGQSMGKPDALSRRADHGSGQADNNNLMLLAPELFRIHTLTGTRLEGEEHNILREVRHSLKDGVQEEVVAKAARELRKDKGRGTVKSAEWSESDGLLMF